jgi:hypothetical protein
MLPSPSLAWSWYRPPRTRADIEFSSFQRLSYRAPAPNPANLAMVSPTHRGHADPAGQMMPVGYPAMPPSTKFIAEIRNSRISMRNARRAAQWQSTSHASRRYSVVRPPQRYWRPGADRRPGPARLRPTGPTFEASLTIVFPLGHAVDV